MRSEILQPCTDISARKTPGEVRPGFHRRSMAEDHDTKPAQRYIRNLCNMPAIRNRSAQTIRTRPDSPRNRSPKINQPIEIRKNRRQNCEIVKFPTKIREKIFQWSWEYLGNRGAFKSCRTKIYKIENFLKKFRKLFFFSRGNFQ